MRNAAFALLLTGFVTTAQASSPDAWREFDREVSNACMKASGLKDARTSKVIGFDDTLGKVVVLVSGKTTVRGRTGNTLLQVSELCVFDQVSKKTWFSSAEGWSAPETR